MSARRPGVFLFSAVLAAASFAAVHFAEAAYPRTIQFSGYTWQVKRSTGKVGPGPNQFSDAANSVWVDAQGRLHLKIQKAKGKWTCAEVISNNSFGYGTYRWYVDSRVDALDPWAVLGLFTWNDDAAFNHREIDVEMSRWGAAANQNAQYVVQPYDVAGNTVRFSQPAVAQSTHSFSWTPSSVFAQSLRGLTATPDGTNLIHQWTFSSGIPQAGGENARMNLWLFRGHAPAAAQEVVISKFEFVPAP